MKLLGPLWSLRDVLDQLQQQQVSWELLRSRASNLVRTTGEADISTVIYWV